jgi:hypothetical protein
MMLPSDGLDDRPPTMFQRVSQSMRSVISPSGTGATGPEEILPPSERRAAMSTLGPVDLKWARAGMVLDAGLSIFLTIYLAADHPTRKVTSKVHGKTVTHLVPLSGSYLLLGAALLLICTAGFIALHRRKRTMVAFAFFLTGFAFTLIFPPLGFALIILGGWLMMRAYRIQKYGTANSKLVAREAAARPSRRGYKTDAVTGKPRGKAARKAAPAERKPPTASKRYTPKAPPRRKVVKPAE